MPQAAPKINADSVRVQRPDFDDAARMPEQIESHLTQFDQGMSAVAANLERLG